MGIFKLKKTEYINIPELKKFGCMWMFIFGGRDTGKSYGVKKEVLIKEAYRPDLEDRDNHHRFIYLRAYDNEVTNDQVFKYFKDMITNSKGEHEIEKITHGKYKSLRVYNGKIFLINVGADGKDKEPPYLIGYFDALNVATKLKSQSMLDVDNVILEEFMNESRPQQCEELVNIISTVARSKIIKVWCVGNNERRNNAWFRYFELKNAMKQEKGTVEIYEFENGDIDQKTGKPVVIKVASCYCHDATKKGMFYGKAVEQNSGDWKAKAKPCVTVQELEKYTKVYTVYFRQYNFGWCGDVYIDDATGGLFWHIREHTKRLPNDARVITDQMSINPLFTQNFTPICKFETLAFDALRNGKAFYTDNLTGTEFEQAYRTFLFYSLGVNE